MKSLFAALGLAASLAVLPAYAADKGDKDAVIAEVNGTKLHASALNAYRQSLPPQMAAQAPYAVLVDMVVNNHLISEQARKENLGNSPEIKEALRQVEQQLLVKAWMNKQLRSQVTDEAVKKRYDQFLAEFKPVEEVRARHVLTETEDQAKAVIAELKKGGDFAEVAKAKSKDPSAKQNGGDLGYFTKEEMVPEFSTAAFDMKSGDLASAPVKSQFGWHVIKVEDRRMASAPTFEQARPVIREQLAEEIAQKLVSDVRSKAKVKMFDQDGNPVAENGKK